MPCFYPLDAWQDLGNQIHFHKSGPGGHRSLGPFLNFKRNIKLPCGRCIGCRLERARQWAIRCMHEASQHDENSFVTLTLKDEYGDCAQEDLCTTPRRMKSAQLTTNHAGSRALGGRSVGVHVDNCAQSKSQEGLSITDHKKFMKRLRKATGTPLRFYMCGEYGEQNWRPHYHYIIFGYGFPDKYLWRTEGEHNYYRSPLLEKVWPFGHSEIGPVTFETCAYVARYVTKKITGPEADEHYRRTATDGTEYWLTPEFNQMSRRPGIAREWWDEFSADVTTGDSVIARGKKSKPPRYYDKLLEAANPELHAKIKEAREKAAKDNAGDNTPARLKTKETVTRAGLALKRNKL